MHRPFRLHKMLKLPSHEQQGSHLQPDGAGAEQLHDTACERSHYLQGRRIASPSLPGQLPHRLGELLQRD